MSGMTETRRDHRLRRMIGRDPHESHRASTPLELLFDLTLVVAFSQAGTQMAHLVELGRYGPAIGAFGFAVFAICWAWINYSWLASAFDNDDVFCRVATLVQMVGVLVLALGLPQLFGSIAEGRHVELGVVVAGYVVMRLSTLAMWLRVARHDAAQRRTALAYAGGIALAQVGWTLLIVIRPSMLVAVALSVGLGIVETAIPPIAESLGRGTPWHPHHIAERYSLLVIITLGEVIAGTIVAISAVVEKQGWTVEAGLVAFGGTALAFGLWWVYFTMPSGELLARHRRRGFLWGYGHLVIFGSLAATGAGLHVAASVIEGVAHLGPLGALLAMVVPVAVFTTALFTLYLLLLRQFDPFQILLAVGALLVLVVAVVAVAAGASIGVGTVITACSPLVVVVGFETSGYRRQAYALERALA